jgi:hypothetical protein
VGLTVSGKNSSIIGDFCYLDVAHGHKGVTCTMAHQKRGAIKKSLKEERLSSILKSKSRAVR